MIIFFFAAFLVMLRYEQDMNNVRRKVITKRGKKVNVESQFWKR